MQAAINAAKAASSLKAGSNVTLADVMTQEILIRAKTVSPV
jgi:hypothetical protein